MTVSSNYDRNTHGVPSSAALLCKAGAQVTGCTAPSVPARLPRPPRTDPSCWQPPVAHHSASDAGHEKAGTAAASHNAGTRLLLMLTLRDLAAAGAQPACTAVLPTRGKAEGSTAHLRESCLFMAAHQVALPGFSSSSEHSRFHYPARLVQAERTAAARRRALQQGHSTSCRNGPVCSCVNCNAPLPQCVAAHCVACVAATPRSAAPLTPTAAASQPTSPGLLTTCGRLQAASQHTQSHV